MGGGVAKRQRVLGLGLGLGLGISPAKLSDVFCFDFIETVFALSLVEWHVVQGNCYFLSLLLC